MVKSGLFELITDDWSYAYHILICVIEDADNFKDFVSRKYEVSNEDFDSDIPTDSFSAKVSYFGYASLYHVEFDDYLLEEL